MAAQYTQPIRNLRQQSGLTLIEIMVSMAIGLFLILGAVTVYTQGRASFQVTEGTSRIQENLRFAFDVMEPDVRMAGFWGMHNDPNNFLTGTVTITCDGSDVSDWAMDHYVGLTARDNVLSADAGNVAANARKAATCGAFADGIKPGTDILEVRHAGGDPVALKPGTVQVQSERAKSHLMSNGVKPADYSALVDESATFDYVFNTYYVSAESQSFEAVPSLRRRTLVGTTVVDEEIIAGVENLQVQLGIDANGDGGVDRYIDPEDDAFNADSSIIAVRLWLLMRAEYAETGLVDKRTYEAPDGTTSEPNDGFRRLKGSKTIFLRNSRS